MAFDEKQQRALRAKLSHHKIKSRSSQGTTIHYIEGWQAIAEANRIFGYDTWDRQTNTPECVWSERLRGVFACLYTAKVRITVRAGSLAIVREGIGTGFGKSESAESAHDIALKAAETDATKRALATFGNPFGLALYDKDRSNVTKPSSRGSRDTEITSAASSSFSLQHRDGTSQACESAADFIAGVQQTLPSLKTVDEVYGFWEMNLSNLTKLRLATEPSNVSPAQDIVTLLKEKLRAIAKKAAETPSTASQVVDSKQRLTGNVDDTERQGTIATGFPKVRRVRDRDHLVFVARHACIICGRKPTQAHHLRFAQPRAMSMKVSDEFTVPLCAAHHGSLHRTGNEKSWWIAHAIDPLPIAEAFWTAPEKSGEIQTSLDLIRGTNTAADAEANLGNNIVKSRRTHDR